MQSLKTSEGGRSTAGFVPDAWQVFAINQETSVTRTGERDLQYECVDIDECSYYWDNYCEDPSDGGVCTNNDGGHDCSCTAGYTGDGIHKDKYIYIATGNSGLVTENQIDPDTITGRVAKLKIQIAEIF